MKAENRVFGEHRQQQHAENEQQIRNAPHDRAGHERSITGTTG